MNIDLYIFNWLNTFTRKWQWLDCLAIFFAEYLGYILIIFLFFYTLNINIGIFLISLLAGFFSRFILNEIVYLFYKRKRPPEVINAKILIKKPNYPSFPSGHTSFFFAFAFSLMFYNFTLGLVFVVLSILISFCRVFAGIHWPSDILAGIVLGALSAILINKII